MGLVSTVWFLILLITSIIMFSSSTSYRITGIGISEQKQPKKWSKHEMIELMKILKETLDVRSGRFSSNAILHEWERLHPETRNRTIKSVLQKAYLLRKKGFTLPPEHNNGVELKIGPYPKERQNVEVHRESEKIQGLQKNYSEQHCKRHHNNPINWNLAAREYNTSLISKTVHATGESSHGVSTHPWDHLELRLGNHDEGTSRVSSLNNNQEHQDKNLSEHNSVSPLTEEKIHHVNNPEHYGPWLYLNSADDPFFKDIHHSD